MPKITLPQKNIILEVEQGRNLMESLLRAGLPVASSCDGDGVCSMCRVRIKGVIEEPSQNELNTLSRNKCDPEERLSCQVSVTSNISVTTRYW